MLVTEKWQTLFSSRKNLGFYYINFYRLKKKANYLINSQTFWGEPFLKRPNFFEGALKRSNLATLLAHPVACLLNYLRVFRIHAFTRFYFMQGNWPKDFWVLESRWQKPTSHCLLQIFANFCTLQRGREGKQYWKYFVLELLMYRFQERRTPPNSFPKRTWEKYLKLWTEIRMVSSRTG